MDPALVARYPFLPSAAELVRADGPPIETLMEGRAWAGARSQGRKRVEAALEGEPVPASHAASEHEALVSVLGYIVARLLVSSIDDDMLTNRYATAEARRVGEQLRTDPEEALLHVAKALGIPAEPREEIYGVPFTDYLQGSKELRALEWKLVNQRMDQGTVLLPRPKLARLVQEAFKQRLLDELPLEVPEVVRETMDTWSREITARIQEIRSEQADLEAEGIEPDWFPPCIKNLISAIKASENVSHEGRFATVAFLNTIGMERDAIVEDLFSNVPDFARGITEYQVDHIVGKKTKSEAYTPPGCSSLQTYGLCPMMSRSEDDWDKWCKHEKMNHPLTYYRWGLFVEKKKQEDEEDAPAGDEASEADEDAAEGDGDDDAVDGGDDRDDDGEDAGATEQGAG